MGTIEKLKHGIKSYGMMLKNSYIPQHKKKQIRQSIASMEKELKRLQALEKLENARLRIDTVRARQNKVRGTQRKGGITGALESVLGPSPDYLGLYGKKGGGGRRRNNDGGIDLGF